MIKRLLGFLLFHANHCSEYKEQFYAIKKKILKRWGTIVDYDLQHLPGIVCNRCEDGIYWKLEDGWLEDYECWCCNGTGWYKPERWVLLRKCKLGRYRFHTPISTAYGRVEWLPKLKVIEGYVEHVSSPYHLDDECTLWLFLLFDRGTFKRFIMRHIGYPYNAITPFVLFLNYRWELMMLKQQDGEL